MKGRRVSPGALKYPVKLEREGRWILASFPDVPGVHTFGGSREEALARAVDALETMFTGLIADTEEIPSPSPVRGRLYVELPPATEEEVLLYRRLLSES